MSTTNLIVGKPRKKLKTMKKVYLRDEKLPTASYFAFFSLPHKFTSLFINHQFEYSKKKWSAIIVGTNGK
jgi:hypothetical protein